MFSFTMIKSWYPIKTKMNNNKTRFTLDKSMKKQHLFDGYLMATARIYAHFLRLSASFPKQQKPLYPLRTSGFFVPVTTITTQSPPNVL